MQSCDKLNRFYQFTYMLLFWTTEPPIVTFEYHINTGTFIPVFHEYAPYCQAHFKLYCFIEPFSTISARELRSLGNFELK